MDSKIADDHYFVVDSIAKCGPAGDLSSLAEVIKYLTSVAVQFLAAHKVRSKRNTRYMNAGDVAYGHDIRRAMGREEI